MASPVQAETQKLPDGQHWLAVASVKDLDEAKGIASYYGSKAVKVMRSRNGWFAVVLGPFAATSKAAIIKIDPDLSDTPADAVLSRGDAYDEVVWTQAASNGTSFEPLTEYSAGRDADPTSGTLHISVKMTGDEDKPGPTLIIGTENGKQLFSFSVAEDYSMFESGAGLLKLDPETERPQLVVTRYNGGPHCCTTTWIVTKPKGSTDWMLVEAPTLDSGGFAFSDLDGDGTFELLSRDNRFLYAFDSYAGSNAPLRISQLQGTTVRDTTHDSRWRGQWRQDVAAMEFSAKLTPSLWLSNGFLAGWVADKILLGEGDAAWNRMLKSYEKDSEFGPSRCLIDMPVDDCPVDKIKRLAFPKALADFLRDAGYLPLPKDAERAARTKG